VIWIVAGVFAIVLAPFVSELVLEYVAGAALIGLFAALFTFHFAIALTAFVVLCACVWQMNGKAAW
jgi:hypothetical protein